MLGMESGAEGSRTLDLLNAMHLIACPGRPRASASVHYTRRSASSVWSVANVHGYSDSHTSATRQTDCTCIDSDVTIQAFVVETIREKLARDATLRYHALPEAIRPISCTVRSDGTETLPMQGGIDTHRPHEAAHVVTMTFGTRPATATDTRACGVPLVFVQITRLFALRTPSG